MSIRGESTKIKTVKKSLTDLISNGVPIQTACQMVGISRVSFYSWYNQGKEMKSGEHKLFYDDVEKAKAIAVVRHIKTINTEAVDNWKAAAWMLSHLSEDFRETPEVNVSVQIDASETRNKLISKINSLAKNRQAANDSE